MVSSLKIIFMLLSMALSIGLPIVLVILLAKRVKFGMRAVLAGVLSFFVLQVVIRIPLLQLVVPNMPFYQSLGPVGLALFLGFTAALFETVGRFIFIKIFLKGKESYGTGIAHGVGHGGIEAIIILGLTYLNYLIYAFMINKGVFWSTLAPEGAPALLVEQLQLVYDLLVDGDAFLFILSGYERVMTMIIHVGLSLLIMEGFIKKKIWLYFIGALLIHMFLDSLAVYLGTQGVSIYLIEGFITLVAIGMVVYIMVSRKRLINQKIEKSILENVEITE